MPEAKLDSREQCEGSKLQLCFKDTRIEIINEIMSWHNDLNSSSIFWLHGLTGTGKSTIARTIGVKAKEEGYITASFFFSRTGAAGQRDPACVFPTLAHQLTASHDQLHQSIGDAALKSSDIKHTVPFTQFQTLIATPLHESKGTEDILIVLDALDECEDIEQKQLQQILACLLDHEYPNAPRIRFLLTSRPEHYLCHELANKPQVVEYDLHRDDESARGDITRFLKAKLPLIPGELGISVEGWPRDGDAQMLSEKSGHLSYSPKLHFASSVILMSRIHDSR